MDGCVRAGKRIIPLRATAGALTRYKEQFRTEYIDDLDRVKYFYEEEKTAEAAKMQLLSSYRLMWSMARTYDKSIPDPDSWLDELGNIDMAKIIIDVTSLWSASLKPTGEVGDKGGEPVTAEGLTALTRACGMDASDMDEYSVGYILAAIHKKIEMESDDGYRMATQEDFDAMAGLC